MRVILSLAAAATLAAIIVSMDDVNLLIKGAGAIAIVMLITCGMSAFRR